MMNKLKAKLIVTLTAVLTAATAFAPFAVRAADLPPSSTTVGSWTVTTLAKNGAEWKVEAYKLDKGLVAWTETNAVSKRRLYAFDGVSTRLLAEMPVGEWGGDGSGFVEAVKGDFDVADGLVVWIMNDGNDREVYSFDGESVKKVSDNSYDDRHPVTGNGRIAWTSQPSSSGAYNLMVKDSSGIKRLASWHVTNYAFSGKTLFWLNKLPSENWFRVFRNDGFATVAIGQGDDRPISQYFITDDKGSASWEYSTKNWSYDKRIVYLSNEGREAVQMLQRDVPPNVTRVEDMDKGRIILNIHDLLYTRLIENVSLIELNGSQPKTILKKGEMSKVRFADDGYVRPREPGANIGLVFQPYDRGEDFVSLEPVIKDRFDADGPTVAGARVGGGIVLYQSGQSHIVTSSVEATDIDVTNGDVAWTEGVGDAKTLKFAAQTVFVKAAYGNAYVSGSLVKAAGSPAVYLAANDGNRYVFPSIGQFNGWYKDFSSVRVISSAKLSAMPLGGNVLYRPGSKLLKTASSPHIYSLDNEGALHWIVSEDALVSVHGKDWKSKLVTVNEATLSDYRYGSSLASDLEYFSMLARQVKR